MRTGVKVANWYERQFFGYLRSRMDAVLPPAPPLPPSPAKVAESLDAKMHTLLDRAVEQSTSSSRQELFHKVLDQIVPDEALHYRRPLRRFSVSAAQRLLPDARWARWARSSWRTCR